MNETEKQRVLQRLRALCARKEYCRYDLEQKLKQWKYTDDSMELMEILQEEAYLDENRYARAFLNDKLKFSKWGLVKVKYYLKGKGVDEQAIHNAIDTVDRELYYKTAKDVLAQKFSSLKDNDLNVRKKKTTAFAQQRGFEMELIIKIISALTVE